MNIYAPDYYALFHCVADRCRHTCCAGWEIDIDSRSLERFRALPGEIGKRVRAGISEEGTPHFALDENGRCPLLEPSGLCALITEAGDGALCDICRDHPRFRNFYTERVEVGLGLVCEEAARIILMRKTPMSLVRIAGNGKEKLNRAEKFLLRERERLFGEIRVTGPKARLLEYLLYRHLADALYGDDLDERIAFVRHAYKAVTAAWDAGNDCIEACREFSDSVEYDDEVLKEQMRIAAAEEGGMRGLADLV